MKLRTVVGSVRARRNNVAVESNNPQNLGFVRATGGGGAGNQALVVGCGEGVQNGEHSQILNMTMSRNARCRDFDVVFENSLDLGG
jgi:hypothetical protein